MHSNHVVGMKIEVNLVNFHVIERFAAQIAHLASRGQNVK